MFRIRVKWVVWMALWFITLMVADRTYAHFHYDPFWLTLIGGIGWQIADTVSEIIGTSFGDW